MKYIKFIFVIIFTNILHTISFSQENNMKNTYDLYPFSQTKKSTIYLSPLPGRINLQEDIDKINQNKIQNVVVLVSKEELNHYKVPELLNYYEKSNIQIFHSPIVDYGLPSVEQMQSILKFMYKKVKSNENVLVHCVGGYGRSGTVMGCYARQYLKKSNDDAIRYVRSIRGNDAIETKEQEDFVKKW